MSRRLDEIFAAIARMPGEEGEKSRLRDRARGYHRACGCALGGLFLTAGFLASVAILILADPFRWRLIPICLLASIGSGLLGKGIGIGWARTRLAFLHRALAGRTAT